MRSKPPLIILSVIIPLIVIEALYLKALPGSAVRVYCTDEMSDFNKPPDSNMTVEYDGYTFDYRMPPAIGDKDQASMRDMPGRSGQDGMTTLLQIANWVRMKMAFGSARGEEEKRVGNFSGGGGRGLCDRYARLFATACQAVEIPARIVELNGHVVPEAFLRGSGRWVMVDPTLGYYLTSGGTPLSVVEIIRAYRDDNPPVPAVFATVRGDDSLYSPADEKTLRDIYLNGFTVVTSQHLQRRRIIDSITRSFKLPIAKLQYLDCNSEKMGRKESILRTALFVSVVVFGIVAVLALAGARRPPSPPSQRRLVGSADKTRPRIIAALLMFAAGACILLYRDDLKLLFASDPPVARYYEYSVHGAPTGRGDIINQEGFHRGAQGLHLRPSTSGRIVFAFGKESGQGCLLRVWFYGDKGKERPNRIRISADGGVTFRQLAGSKNYVGAVFELSELLKDATTFQLSFEAENHAPYPAPAFDGMELVIGSGHQVKPALPSLPKVPGLLILACLLGGIVFLKHLTREEKVLRILLVLIILLAAYLRWHELVRLSGTILDEDARGYYTYAQKMSILGEHGFYSADFEKREPLYILVVKLFFALFGASATHLRFVSFVFSLLTIYLCYRIGKEWFHPLAGLIAAFILAVHPYLVQLSARGLREEWFTALLLLFVYWGYVQRGLGPRLRVVTTGILGGCILLTRAECLPLIILMCLLYPLGAPEKWSYPGAIIACILAIALLLPHQYSMYKKYGDPFYTANQYARFYANREFAGRPGFPTPSEITERGMYYGPRITPLQYYFSLHTPWQLISSSLVGFVKIHLKMPFAYVSGQGNAAAVLYRVDRIRDDPRAGEVAGLFTYAASLISGRWWGALMGFTVLFTFIWGLVLMGYLRYWMFYVCLLLFQMHTSFLAHLGLDERLSIHSYPLIALCCGFCLYGLYYRYGSTGGSPPPVRLRVF